MSSKNPIWQDRLNNWRPELQVKPIVACFKRKVSSDFPFITAILPNDEISFSSGAYSARSIDKAAKLLTEALSLAEKYDLELRGDDFASTLILFKSVFWRNNDTGAFITANFEVTLNFEPTSPNFQDANPYFDLLMDAAVVDGAYELRAPLRDNPKNIVGLRSACKEFFNFMQNARTHPDIMAPFGRFDELPSLPNVDENDIFKITYKNRDDKIVTDRFCALRRSIFSMPETKKIKWIEGYSEANRMMLDLKLSNVLSIELDHSKGGMFTQGGYYQSVKFLNGDEWKC